MKRSILLQWIVPDKAACRPMMFRKLNRSINNHYDHYSTVNYNSNYCYYYYSSTNIVEFAKPLQRGQNSNHPNDNSNKQIDSFPTVNVYCTTCSIRLFRYKKKNGTKSHLVKCYVERIIDDCVHLLRDQHYNTGSHANNNSHYNNSSSESQQDVVGNDTNSHPPQHDPLQHREYYCPNCQTKIARYARINHLPSLKWVGGKIRMSKK
jgi:hypothetical protein